MGDGEDDEEDTCPCVLACCRWSPGFGEEVIGYGGVEGHIHHMVFGGGGGGVVHAFHPGKEIGCDWGEVVVLNQTRHRRHFRIIQFVLTK